MQTKQHFITNLRYVSKFESRPDPHILLNFLTWSDPTHRSGQWSCNSRSEIFWTTTI